MNARIHSDDTELAEECRAFGVYLTGTEPDEYVCEKYRDAHRVTDLIGPVAPPAFDRFILRFSRRNRLSTKLADIYTRWFLRRCVLRRKLLLLLAILECAGSSFRHFESGENRTRFGFYLWLAGQGIAFIVCAVGGLVIFSVARCLFGLNPASRRTEPTEERWASS